MNVRTSEQFRTLEAGRFHRSALARCDIPPIDGLGAVVTAPMSATVNYFARACKVIEFLSYRSACGLASTGWEIKVLLAGSSLASLDFIGGYIPHFVRRDLLVNIPFLYSPIVTAE